jgi:hypothetical protein
LAAAVDFTGIEARMPECHGDPLGKGARCMIRIHACHFRYADVGFYRNSEGQVFRCGDFSDLGDIKIDVGNGHRQARQCP